MCARVEQVMAVTARTGVEARVPQSRFRRLQALAILLRTGGGGAGRYID